MLQNTYTYDFKTRSYRARGQSVVETTAIAMERASIGTYFDSAGIMQTASPNLARFDHDPATLLPRGLYLEQEATNRWLRGQELNSAPWIKPNITVESDVLAAPDGTTSVDKAVGSGAGSIAHNLRQDIAVVAGETYSFSVYAAGVERLRFSQYAFHASGTATTYYWDTSTRTIPYSASILGDPSLVAFQRISENSGTLWRYEANFRNPAAALSSVFLRIIGLNTGSTDVYDAATYPGGMHLWGVQYELGTRATSYIPTFGSTATRAVETLTIKATGKNNWIVTFEDGTTKDYPATVGDLVIKATEFIEPKRIVSATATGDVGPPIYPLELPAPLRDNYSIGAGDGRFRSQNDAGPPNIRGRFSSAPQAVSFSTLLDRTQLGRFERFFETEIKKGALPFYMRAPSSDQYVWLDENGAPILCEDGITPILISDTWLVMMDQLSTVQTRDIYWTVSFTLMVMP